MRGERDFSRYFGSREAGPRALLCEIEGADFG